MNLLHYRVSRPDVFNHQPVIRGNPSSPSRKNEINFYIRFSFALCCQGRRHEFLRGAGTNRRQCGQPTPKIGEYLGHFSLESGGDIRS